MKSSPHKSTSNFSLEILALFHLKASFKSRFHFPDGVQESYKMYDIYFYHFVYKTKQKKIINPLLLLLLSVKIVLFSQFFARHYFFISVDFRILFNPIESLANHNDVIITIKN